MSKESSIDYGTLTGVNIECNKLIQVLDSLPKKEDYKEVIKEAHVKCGTLASVNDECDKLIQLLDSLPKEEDYKKAIKEAHDEYGTLTEDDANKLFSFKHFIKSIFSKNKKDKWFNKPLEQNF